MDKEIAAKFIELAEKCQDHLSNMSNVSQEEMDFSEFEYFRDNKISPHMGDIFFDFINPIYSIFPEMNFEKIEKNKEKQYSPAEIKENRLRTIEKQKMRQIKKKHNENGVIGEKMTKGTAIKIVQESLLYSKCLDAISNEARRGLDIEEAGFVIQWTENYKQKIRKDFLSPAYRDFPDLVGNNS